VLDRDLNNILGDVGDGYHAPSHPSEVGQKFDREGKIRKHASLAGVDHSWLMRFATEGNPLFDAREA
jgi:hypothetical protein